MAVKVSNGFCVLSTYIGCFVEALCTNCRLCRSQKGYLSPKECVCVSVKSEAGATKPKNLSDEINLSVDCCGRVLMAVMPIKAIPLSKSNMQQGL